MNTRDQLMLIVANTVYGSVFRQYARRLLQEINSSMGTESTQLLSSISEDEVSEEIIVWGEREEGSGGGGTDTITLDPWMWEFTIKIQVPRTIPTNPIPPTGGDTPPPDPCADLAQRIADFNTILAGDNASLKALDQLIAEANSPAVRKALRAQKQNTLGSIEQTEKAIQDCKDEMAKLHC